MPTPIFFISVLAFGTGIALATVLQLGFSGGGFLVFIGVIIGTFSYSVKDKKIGIAAFVLLALGFGVMRFEMANVREGSLNAFVEHRISLGGVVVDEPDMRENSLHLIVQPDNAEGKILITVDRLSDFRYGDRIHAFGKLVYPKNFEGQNGRIFDYTSYLAKDGIRYEMRFPQVDKIGSHEGNMVKEKLFALKHFFLAVIENNVPEPEASLLGGILLGAKQSLGQKILSDFQKSGLVHIVVLSGYNISLIVNWAMKLFTSLPRIMALSFGSVALLAFVVMTGAGATGVRAGIMALIVLIAAYSGRKADSMRLLIFVAFIMVLWNPNILLYDPSFQLSFLATLGLFALGPVIEERLEFITERCGFREIISSTIATQIFVLPLILYMSGTFSLFALPANILVLPLVPIAMVIGASVGIVGLVSPIMAFPFSALSFALLSYIMSVAYFFSHIPFSVFIIPVFSVWVLLLAYAILLFLVFRKR